jgi:hypothetical protein
VGASWPVRRVLRPRACPTPRRRRFGLLACIQSSLVAAEGGTCAGVDGNAGALGRRILQKGGRLTMRCRPERRCIGAGPQRPLHALPSVADSWYTCALLNVRV